MKNKNRNKKNFFYSLLILLLFINTFICASTSEMVTIYHRVGKDGTIESVKKHGLLTFRELFNKGIIHDDPEKIRGKLTFHDQYDVIYFDPNKVEGYHDTNNTVGIQVDPNSTYVYNRILRVSKNSAVYQHSKILLAIYLENLNRVNLKRKELEEEQKQGIKKDYFIAIDPITATPFEMLFTPQAKSVNFYNPEILINRPCIPPNELIFFDDHDKASENQ